MLRDAQSDLKAACQPQAAFLFGLRRQRSDIRNEIAHCVPQITRCIILARRIPFLSELVKVGAPRFDQPFEYLAS